MYLHPRLYPSDRQSQIPHIIFKKAIKSNNGIYNPYLNLNLNSNVAAEANNDCDEIDNKLLNDFRHLLDKTEKQITGKQQNHINI